MPRRSSDVLRQSSRQMIEQQSYPLCSFSVPAHHQPDFTGESEVFLQDADQVGVLARDIEMERANANPRPDGCRMHCRIVTPEPKLRASGRRRSAVRGSQDILILIKSD